MAVDPATHKNYTPNGSNVIKWNYEPPSTTQILDPAIVNALTQSEVHSYGDFQAQHRRPLRGVRARPAR